MEKQLYYGAVLPLEEIAIRKVTINLWNESILDSGRNVDSGCSVDSGQWNFIEDEVKGKVSKLMLPESFKKRMMHLVKPIGSDIRYWIAFYEYYFLRLWKPAIGKSGFDQHFVLKFRRSWLGAIDYQKTAEEFAHLEELVPFHRFLFACIFCLEDKIPLLWEEISESIKTYIKKKYDDYDHHWFDDHQMLYYWCVLMGEDKSNLERILEKQRFNLSSFYRQQFKMSAVKGNKAATEYFFQKLANEDRDILFRTVVAVIVKGKRMCYITSKRGYYVSYFNGEGFEPAQLSGVLYYLLSLMTLEEQMQVLSKNPSLVSSLFLYWPFEYLFVPITDLCWSFLPDSPDAFLSNVCDIIKLENYYFPKVVQEFFLHSPSSFRKCFVYEECSFSYTKRATNYLLPAFFLTEDIETIVVIFRNIDAGDRVRLVFSEPVFKLLNDSLVRGSWNFVEVLIREATLSKDDRVRLKGNFLEYVTRTEHEWEAFMRSGILEPKRRMYEGKRFYEFLDEMDGGVTDQGSTGDEKPAKVLKSCNYE